MSVNNSNITKDISSLSLDNIIKKILKVTSNFSELNSYDKGKIVEYIFKNDIKMKIIDCAGFDVLKNELYVRMYAYDENTFCKFVIEHIYFKTFDMFYNFLNGKIYEKTCFYGYSFEPKIILKYNIDISRINFYAFIDYDISNYTFESLNILKNEEKKLALETNKKISKWISKFDVIENYETLIKKHNCFKSKFDCYESSKIFFSLILQKCKDQVKNYVVNYIRNNGSNNGINIEDIFYYYGISTAKECLDNYVGSYWLAYSTIKKHLKKHKQKLELLQDEKTTCIKKGYFDKDTYLYYVKYIYSNNNNLAFASITKYFISFDDFVKELDGDLSDVDLSNTFLNVDKLSIYKTNEKTILPMVDGYHYYNIDKYYNGNEFIVYQEWLDKEKKRIYYSRKSFEFFCDFVHFLKGDLSNSDLILANGVENLVKYKDLNIKDIKVRSNAAKILNIKLNLIPHALFQTVNYKNSEKLELSTKDAFMEKRNIENYEYSNEISYVTDIHLIHKYKVWGCETYEDIIFINRKIAKEIAEDELRIKLIGGDVCSDLEVYKLFVSTLKEYNARSKIFFTLGNHEMWSFSNVQIKDIVNVYKDILNSQGMYLVQNNLFYFENGLINEITTEELETFDIGKLKIKLRGAELIIFGGIGFSGKNTEFNANNGIYKSVVDRVQEITESQFFDDIYNKVVEASYGKNVIIFTHMPMTDWSSRHEVNGFVYVSGHNHRNYYFDDGKKRIYQDNQIGYKLKNVYMKHLSIDMGYDWFANYGDGIYEITRDDYVKFYRGIRETISFNRQFMNLYMLKRDNNYMFIMRNMHGNIQILNGGVIKNSLYQDLEYYYENLAKYSKSVKMFLVNYGEFQKKVAAEVKNIGGLGKIHGSIVDIDYYSHLYLNPLDGTITPYFALSMVEKYVYTNLPSLLKYKCPELYLNYETKYLSRKNQSSSMLFNNSFKISKKTKFIGSTVSVKNTT